MSSTPEANESARGLRALDRRAVIAIAGGLVVLLAVLWFLVLRPEPTSQQAEAPPPPPAPRSSPLPEAPTHRAGGGRVETFQVFAPRDPFEPLVKPSSGGNGTGGSGGNGGTGGGTGGTGGGGGPTLGGTSVGGHTVSVIDVYKARRGNRAQVEVDATVYTVDEGETFADNFTLVSAAGDCATMLHRDDNFTLCEGEEILK